VKSIRNSTANAAVYATAGRDGKIFLWDDRCNGSSNPETGATDFAPIATISNDLITPVFSGKTRGQATTNGSNSSYTGIEFLHAG
jgi:hypothetical protein